MRKNSGMADYWRGYRSAKIDVYIAGLEQCDKADKSYDETSAYYRGYASGLESCSNAVMELLRNDKLYQDLELLRNDKPYQDFD